MASPLQFPYMFWAHHEGSLSPYCLAQSGMPTPPMDFLGGLKVDLAHPCLEQLPELTKRLAKLYKVPEERVLVTTGASSGLHVAAMLWFRAGARVAVEVPSYEPLRKLPHFYGADLRPLMRHQDHGWQIEPEQAREALKEGQGPGHIFLTNPNDPTGALMDRSRMQALAREAEEQGGNLVSGEIYQEYIPNKLRVHAFELAPNTVSISGLTKAYGLGALRIGWMILGESVAEQMMNLQDMTYLTYIDPATSSMAAARLALDHLPQLLQPLAKVNAESRPMWERWLRETPGISCEIPPHGIIAFPRVHGVRDTAALAYFLQENYQVDVVPGEYFGLPGHLRVACGIPDETLRVGLQRLAEGIHAFRQQIA